MAAPVSLDRDDTREVFRLAVLEALDRAARETFRQYSRNDAGASDADLPHIFPAIDSQVDRLAQRYGIILVDRV